MRWASVALSTLLPITFAGCKDDNDEAGSGESAAATSSETSTGTSGDTSDETSECGNGVIEPGEECDDGNTVDTDACDNTCTETSCGDGIMQDGEECDDANDDDTDACTNMCLGPECGDGIEQEGEECDLGPDNADDEQCTSVCSEAVCGDGLVGPGEGCDDGNDVDDDECTNECKGADCGDGVLQADQGEVCDDGNDDNNDACLDTCVPNSCGDGFPYTDVETCDDGNADNDDECTTLCEAPSCVDGILSGDELDVDCGGSCGSCFGLSQHTWKGVTVVEDDWTQIEAANYDLRTRGGDLEIELSIPLFGGGDSACRPTVDGEWAGSFEGLDEDFEWHEGRDRTNYAPRQWTRMRVYYDIPAGDHVLGVQCRTSTDELNVGRVESSSVILTREYDGVDSDVHQRITLETTTIPAAQGMVKLPGSQLTRDVGGTIEVAISVPIGNGGYAACLPWMDNQPIPSPGQPYTNAQWQAGIASTYNSWKLWTHSRTYDDIPQDTHTFDIRCHHNSGDLHVGEEGAASVLIVRELDNDDQVVSQALDVHADGWEINGNGGIQPDNWYPLAGYETDIDVVHGALDVTSFVIYHHVNAGAWLSCRPIIDGAWLGTFSADFESNEEEGVVHQLYSNSHYDMWHRRRIYTDIPQGDHTIGLECLSNGNHYFVGNEGKGTLTVRDVPLINGD